MKTLIILPLLVLCMLPAAAATYQWTNTLGGDWFTPANWSPNGVPNGNDVANISANGTYSVNILTSAVTVATINLGGASGTQTLLNGTASNLAITNAGTVQVNGVLIITNGGLQGNVTIQAGGELQLSGGVSKNVYQLTLNNQGTVTWSGGTLLGGSTPSTVINNSGLWQITDGYQIYSAYGGAQMIWTNSGILRKNGGSATSYVQDFNFYNQPSGVIDTLTGTLAISGGPNSVLGGSLTATAPGIMNITGGTWTDAGGSASGSGTNQFSGGILNLRTNIIPGLRLTGGNVYVTGTTTFQQAGAITNLTLDGSQLSGTNFIGGGIVTVNSGGMMGMTTVLPAGQLILATGVSKNVYQLTLNNQGTVTWSGGTLLGGSTPSTVINNSGLWQITDGYQIYSAYGGAQMIWTNSGILRKNGGSATSYVQDFNFYNQPSGVIDTLTGTLAISGGPNSVLGGSLTATAPGIMNITGGTWTDAGGSASGSGTNQFSGGILNLRTNIIPGLRLTGGNVYVTGTTTFQQAGAITNLTLDGSQLSGTNFIGGGIVTVNSGGMMGMTTVLPAGQLILATGVSKNVYQLTLNNQGTVTWSGGTLLGGSTPSTVINNSGLWQITDGYQIYSAYGGAQMIWTNSGILRKNGGSATSYVQDFNFYNQPSGVIDTLTGTLAISGGPNSVLGGSLTATAPGIMNITGGTWTDAGGSASGSGTNQFSGGILNLRTNIIPGLRLTGGNVYVTGTTTFQQAGAITNLTLDGSQLSGTNFIGGGIVTVNSGGMMGMTTVLPAGQLILATGVSKNVYQLTLNNQGTVTWSGGTLLGGSTPSTVINNSGLWQITDGYQIYSAYGGAQMIWTNSGILRKNGGSATSYIQDFNLVNQPAGLIQVDTGTLQMPSGFTNTSGILRLNGGTLTTGGILGFNGGTLEGSGTVGANALTGGNITPGQGGPGLLQFNSGLNLSTNATVILSGTGTTPGTEYDQLSVTGPVALSNATLQVTSLPSVAGGTVFVIILNDGADAVGGTFNGLPENSLMAVSGQSFRIHYAGGSGNDVTLVRDGTPAGAQLTTNGGITNGVWWFSGSGTPSGIYGIQATTNFIQWTNIGFATGDLSGKFSFADSNAFRFNYRFYRTTN